VPTKPETSICKRGGKKRNEELPKGDKLTSGREILRKGKEENRRRPRATAEK